MSKKSVPAISDYQVISRIHTVRGHKVMLDSDLAGFYQVETRVLNQAGKRNAKRFLTGASVTAVSGTSYKLAPGMGE